MYLMRASVSLILAFLLFLTATHAQEATPKLKVGIFERPPFAMKDDKGVWSGLSVDLWVRISERVHLDYDFVDVSPDNAISEIADGKLDLLVGEVGVSADRSRIIDFTQPYLFSPAAVVTLTATQSPQWAEFMEEVAQHGVLKIVLIMLGMLVLFSLFLWLLERRAHQGHFSGRPIHGFGSALWFAAVTMTTVGYGDKTPQTAAGRFLAFFWMFFGILLVGAFTGTVASSITVSRLHSKINGIEDLAHYRDGAMQGSLSYDIMKDLGIPAQTFPTAEEGLKALKDQKITAFVGNEATLRYLVNQNYQGVFQVTDLSTAHVSFAIAVRRGLPAFQDINVALIAITTGSGWQNDMNRWLGQPGPK